MIRAAIQEYLNQLSDLRRISGTDRESVVREAFKDLLKILAKRHDLLFVAEYEITTPAKERRYVDGALLHSLRVPFGYWEAKDEKDDIDAEIVHKRRRGYPTDNIIFEDSTRAVLIQNGEEVMRSTVEDVAGLERLLRLFFEYQPGEITEFRRAVDQFRFDIPAVLAALREMIEAAHASNPRFREASARFLEHAREAINPSLTAADVREMLIQHILTEEIFSKIFGEDDFHRNNNVAKALYTLEGTFFTGDLKKRTLKALDPYYAAIRSAAALITSHHEKQSFLKAIYENFYKVYNSKAADRLGVVYTPNAVVRFMVEGADALCRTHFGKGLIDPGVAILDPATGTGTFLCELIEFFRGQKYALRQKYREELHANEVAILPYYVANLNIEATYAAITGEYEEFPNLCFVDTLDNVHGLRKYHGHMDDLFGSVSEENVGRIRRQNARKISVVIGNPPYNANQKNENENNKNREYLEIDKRIKDTYIKASTAQKTKLYDMYARFFRWASDRVDENGIVAFVTNRSFLESRTFDGFRKEVAKEFHEIRIVDLGGDVRANPRLSGPRHNVFAIQTGVAIGFFLKKKGPKECRIFYARRPELETAEEKLAFLERTKPGAVAYEEIRPDVDGHWLHQSTSDFDTLVPVASKAAKLAKRPSDEKAIFKLYSLGVVTNRDEWVYGATPQEVERKVRFLIENYNGEVARLRDHRGSADLADRLDTTIKWTRAVKNDLRKGIGYRFDKACLTQGYYRPFVSRWLYFSPQLNEMVYQMPSLFGPTLGANMGICLVSEERATFSVMATDRLPNKDVFMPSASQTLPLYRFEVSGERVDNITDWALNLFRKRYPAGRGKGALPVTKEEIFRYVYAVLHDPAYREKYALDLRRDIPRIPLYGGFREWVDLGDALLSLHVGYEQADPFPLVRTEVPEARRRKGGLPPNCLLRAELESGTIRIDDDTTLTGIPSAAWEYKLGNRSAIEWVLDQHKERKPKDPTIRERFDTYRFADHKEAVIDLLRRVTTVSVETMKIIGAMARAPR